MFNWFKSKGVASDSHARWYRALSDDGLLFVSDLETLDVQLRAAATPIDSPELDGLFLQMEDEGIVEPLATGHFLPWAGMYDLLDMPGYQSSMPILGLPPVKPYAPILESQESLTDQSFSISVAGWHDGQGRPLGHAVLQGAFLRQHDEVFLVSRASWQVLQRVAAFHQRPESERSDTGNRRVWGAIRQAALMANARLDDFLFRSVVLTPEKLKIGLRKVDVGDTRVIEVAPSFEGAPDSWLDTFDAFRSVQDRYDIPTPDGIIQVLVTPAVRTVLEQVKRMPAGRRVAGTRAEAFIANPFAALGEAASEVIDPEQFERAREEAGLFFEHFAAHIEKDALGYPVKVGLLIERAGRTGLEESELRPFERDSELEDFLSLAQQKLDAGMQYCGWEGYDFELMGDTPRELQALRDALGARRKPRVFVSYADIHDLTHYAQRVENIGIEKPYYSPFIAKKKDEEGWFPENVVPVISWIPDGDSEPIAVPINEEAKEQLRGKIDAAKRDGKDSFDLPGFDKPIPVKEAEFILGTFEEAITDIRKGTFEPTRERNKTPRRSERLSLIARANIQSIDYEEARRDILLSLPTDPEIPRALKATIHLRDHQRTGLAWLQHLYLKSPEHCRGSVLADDMGLGKTLQLLMLIAWAFETNPDLPPALVVAPLSLLENWDEESKTFFRPDTLPILTAYGSMLTLLRVPRTSIDAQLQSEGLVKFLKPGWRGDAKIVLTTYETLRDLEFSFGAEKWSIMVCDEAQKIKNPNALVTRAAKKQNVAFKIACTGTPVENTLADLWCLFDFVQPALLGALNDFGRRYRRPIEAETDEEKARVEELREKIKPQILRRMKEDVAKDLPKKTAVPARMLISGHQRSLYSHAIQLFKKRNDPAARVPFKNHLGLLHYLRLICTDPRRYGLDVFVPEPLSEYRTRAPKLAWLLQTLEDIRVRNEKAIIFCEFRAMQRMLQHYVKEVFGYSPDIINGDTTVNAKSSASRQKRIKAFQEKAGFGVIILSPVAVGFGVNIQKANHVIHYTRTWNPAKEDQATDRAYRIGQEREVFVYCPVVFADDFTTFDVKLDELLEHKRTLARDMLNGSGDIGPGEFDLGEVAPEGDAVFGERITLDDALQMRWDYFECLVAALWQKKGYKRVSRTPQTDDGVDVVAILDDHGELVQCKSSGVDATELSWDAVKDVVTGEAAYRLRYPGVSFQKTCITNQYFNSTAVTHANLNSVELYDQKGLAKLLDEHLVTMLDVERFLYAEWEHAAETG